MHSGNTVIYEITALLTPPGRLRQTSPDGLSLLRSFQHLISTKLDGRVLFDESAITLFLPVDHAWKTLGLVEKYLLSDATGDTLRRVLLHSFLKGIHYSRDLPSETKPFTSINGDTISVHIEGRDIVFDDLKYHLDERDILISNGVAHLLSAVPIPPSVIITPRNLINVTNSAAWCDILGQYNLTDFLDLNSNYSLLIPTDDAVSMSPLKTMNIEAAKSLIDMHIIPPINGQAPPDLLADIPVTQHTLAGRAISVRQIYPDIWSVQINGSTVSARVLDQGKTSNGAQILLIDQVLFEPTIPKKWAWARPLSVGIFGIAMIVIIGAGINYAIRTWRRYRDTKPLFCPDNHEESERLLNGQA